MALNYVKAEPIFLKNHPEFNEAWLQDRIADDTTILGLGDVDLIQRERIQPRAGRLDLLLYDQGDNMRYEVELMLGTTDESHIIRCIEYWDNERRRYPAYDHCAVLVAEDVTARFLNVISLIAGSIPLIVIQLNALQVGDAIVLNFVRVIDRTPPRVDDEAEVAASVVDRSHWVERSSQSTVSMIDSLFSTINETAQTKLQLRYVRSYIGLFDGTRARNIVWFHARKQYAYVHAKVRGISEWKERLENAGMDAGTQPRYGAVWIKLAPQDLQVHEALVRELLHEAVRNHQQD